MIIVSKRYEKRKDVLSTYQKTAQRWRDGIVLLLKLKNADVIKRKVLVSRNSQQNFIAKTPKTLGEYRFLSNQGMYNLQTMLVNAL